MILILAIDGWLQTIRLPAVLNNLDHAPLTSATPSSGTSESLPATVGHEQ